MRGAGAQREVVRRKNLNEDRVICHEPTQRTNVDSRTTDGVSDVIANCKESETAIRPASTDTRSNQRVEHCCPGTAFIVQRQLGFTAGHD